MHMSSKRVAGKAEKFHHQLQVLTTYPNKQSGTGKQYLSGSSPTIHRHVYYIHVHTLILKLNSTEYELQGLHCISHNVHSFLPYIQH